MRLLASATGNGRSNRSPISVASIGRWRPSAVLAGRLGRSRRSRGPPAEMAYFQRLMRANACLTTGFARDGGAPGATAP